MANQNAKSASAIVVCLVAGAPFAIPHAANAAECLTEPRQDTPQGQHWYYRLERGTKRHCWYLRGESKDAAEKLVKWMDTAEFGQLAADNLSMFSAVPGVTYGDPVLQQMWSDYQASPAAYLMLVNYRYCNPTADSILATDTQKMFLGQMTPQQVADDVANGVSTCTLPKF